MRSSLQFEKRAGPWAGSSEMIEEDSKRSPMRVFAMTAQDQTPLHLQLFRRARGATLGAAELIGPRIDGHATAGADHELMFGKQPEHSVWDQACQRRQCGDKQ